MDGSDDGVCTLCNTELETPSHIILTCPRLIQIRANTFKRYQADLIVQSWEVKQMVSFLAVEHIAAMEQEDYSNLP